MKGKEHVFLTNFQPSKIWTLLQNSIQALFWVLIKRPNVIITTGAGVTVPTVFFSKKILGTKIIFINSAADVTTPSRTPVWIEKYADLFLVQWEELLKVFPNATCCGLL
jgi:UDP-N-acetylglucosamine:LPS N-acetylglucosamine transferase